ncbi:hypothetical protein SeMB42_g05292 [Synchytrium endobioticum]|uniref:Vacuolar protein sorting-associated protein n=1 Tax=Synchytrium endobioticum TaxID=286115 RepID=A0A507CSF0_9FUNG|nr:hypothetical protein SeMB42_g05292 [Synchytrium endobioticum]TPX45712.1 hypothetical protein SeLEV6574_g03703 [Synchytrium endobioticum]
MFEGIIAQVLNKFLGDYVANLETKQLSLSIWRGDVVLNNLRLKKEALDKFNLPIEVKEGYLGELILKIPWNDLKNTPVRVFVNNLYILAQPRGETGYDPDEEEERAQNVKREKLENINMLNQTKNVEPENEKQRESFVESLVTKIVNNLQMTVKNIHIRYEDKVTNPHFPFALGVTLSELSAVSTDENWQEKFIQDNASAMYKLTLLESLAVYWDTRTNLIPASDNPQDFLDTFASMIPTKSNVPDHQYILRPVSGMGKAKINKQYSQEAKTGIVLDFEELAFALDDEQYQDMFALLGSFSFMWRRQQYRKYRPPRTITPRLDPQAWFKYAGTCILSEIHDRNRRWTWDFFAERRDDRLSYINLYKEQKLATISQEGLRELNELERKLSFEDIRFYRSIADGQLKKENAKPVTKAEQESTVGWIASWFYPSSYVGTHAQKDQPPGEQSQSEPTVTQPHSDDPSKNPAVGFGEDQVQELFNTIDYNPETATASSDLPPATIVVGLKCNLNKGSVALRKSPREKEGGVTLISVEFEKLAANVDQRPASMGVKFAVGGMKVMDGVTPKTFYPVVVQAKSTKEHSADKATLKAPFFDMELDHNPLDGHADDAISIKMLPLEVIYNPAVITTITTFLTPPPDEYVMANTITAVAKESLKSVTAQTRAGLEYALESHRTLDLKVDIDAPIFVFPESCIEPDGQILLIDAGHLLIESKLADQKAKDELENKPELSENDLERLKSLMYDKFDCNISSVQGLIGGSLDVCLDAIGKRHPGEMHLIEQVNIHLLIEISILPKLTEATRTRVSGRLERIHLNVSDRKYKTLMKLIDLITGASTATPKNSNNEKQNKQAKEASAIEWNFMSADKMHDLVVHDSDDNESFYDAPEAVGTQPRRRRSISGVSPEPVKVGGKVKQAETSPSVQEADRVLMEFIFEVGQMSASLKKADRNQKMKETALAELFINDFNLTFQQKQVDMGVTVRIRDIRIEDKMQDPDSKFKYLLAASAFTEANVKDDDPNTNLIHLHYEKIDSQSPHYQGMDSSVDVKVAGIDVTLTRASVLNLYDFILITFTTVGPAPSKSSSSSMQNITSEKLGLIAPFESTAKAEEQQAQQKLEEAADDDATSNVAPQEATGTMLVNVDVEKIDIIINQDGVRLATAYLGQEKVSVMLKPKTMSVSARIGSLIMVDDIPRVEDGRLFQQLICIDGDQAADFTFSTFSPYEPDYPGHDSEMILHGSALKITYIEPLIASLMTYFAEFQKMHVALEYARRAAYEGAQQVQETAGRLHFDIDIQAPILVFPRLSLKSPDALTLYLGRLSASNTFKSDGENGDVGSVVTAEVQDLRATSVFHFGPRNVEHVLQMLDNVNIKMSVDQVGPASNVDAIVPEMIIRALLPEVKVKLTEMQYQFVMELATSVTRLSGSTNAPVESDDQEDTEAEGDANSPPAYTDAISANDGNRSYMDVFVELPSLGLEMYGGDGYAVKLENASIARCAISSTSFKAAMRKNGSSDMELVVHSISILDTRPDQNNLFQDVISSVRHDGHQFAMHISKSILGATNMVLTIDSPKITLVLDHIFAMRDFFMAPMGVNAMDSSKPADQPTSPVSSSQPQPPPPTYSNDSDANAFSYRVDLIDVEIVLLEDPARRDTEAIILKSQQLVVAHEMITTASIHDMGMFFCAMDKRDETTLRFIQNFDLTVAADSRTTGPGHYLSNVQIDVGPLMLRISYRDIRLILDIVNRVSELSNESQSKAKNANPANSKPIIVAAPASPTAGGQAPPSEQSGPGGVSSSTSKGIASDHKGANYLDRSKKGEASDTSLNTLVSRSGSSGSGSKEDEKGKERNNTVEVMNNTGIIMSRERAQLMTQGLRLVLIDDLNDLHLPMADLVFNKIDGRIADWSSLMTVHSEISLHMNYFNLHNSHWEPVIEPWSFNISVASKSTTDSGTTVDIYARKKLEMNVTHILLQTILNTQALWSKQTGRKARRGTHTPYVLRNRTGYRVHLWVDTNGDRMDVEPKELKNNDDMPWRFDDWRAMREATAISPNKISLQLHGPAWESLKGISVDREGVTTHLLRPRVNGVLHRLVCEVKLKDNIKIVTFRSTTVLVNGTGGTVDMMVVSVKGEMTSGVYRIAPGEECPIPIEAAFYDKILVKPHDKQGYKWSSEVLDWRELQRTRMYPLVSCHPIDSSKPAFRFQVNSTYPDDATRSGYPNLTIKLLPPFQLENLLPHDIRYIVFDKTAKLEYRQTLKKGTIDPVHTLDPTHLLALNIDIPGTDYLTSEVAIISNTELDYRDESISLRDREGRQLLLRVKYTDNLRYGGRKVSLYSPYLLVNKTGLDMAFQARTLLAGTRFAAGDTSASPSQMKRPRTQPEAFMFSYSNFEPITSRAQIKAGDSEWSKPLSFEAVGSSYEVTVPSASNKNNEVHIGVCIKEGEGRYYLTKVVTFTPRFVIKNNMSEDVHCRQQGVNQPTVAIKAGDVVPLASLLRGEGRQQLCTRLTGLTNEWSSPFNIDQVGRVWVKLGRMGSSEEDLVRAEITLDGPTVFIQLTREEGRWPFRIVNDSEVDVVIGQNNSKNRYRISKGQSRPYAWDQPAAPHKALILHVNGRERGIDVMEIGQLVPFKYPIDAVGRQSGIMAIQVMLEGPCVVISLKPYIEAQSIFRQRAKDSKDQSGQGFEVNLKDADILMTFNLRLEGIGVSLINRNMVEILYATIRGVSLRYTDTSANQLINFDIRWIQIDNQLYGGIEPIIMYPTIIKKETENGVHPVLFVVVSKLKDTSYGVEYYNFFTLLLQEFSIELDEDFLFALLDFSKFSNAGGEEKEPELYDTSMTIPTPQSSDFQTPFYFEKFLLQPIKLNLSFSRTERVNREEPATRGSTNIIGFVVDVLTMTVGNLHDAPIALNALELQHPVETPSKLMELVMKFYAQEGIGQIHKILGSADFLGNPVGLFNNITSGASDFFYEPFEGFEITRPEMFGIGLVKGTASFVKKTVYGVSDTFASFTGSVAKGLSVITLDKEYQEKRRIHSTRNRPRHLGSGMASGAHSFVTSVTSGLAGVLAKPMEGAEKDGVGGFFKGLGMGLVGAVTKPVVGVFDLATNVGEGLRNTTVWEGYELDKIRLPRFIGRDKILKSYNAMEALGQNWLKQVENGHYFHEDYVGHLELRIEDLVTIITTTRILMVRVKKLKVDWDVPFEDLQLVRSENAGISLIIHKQQAKVRIIPCPDLNSAQYLCAKVEEAFSQFMSERRPVE